MINIFMNIYLEKNACVKKVKKLKPFQNKKGQKNPGALFSVSFSQLPAVKKTENDAPGNFFGPSYFVTALIGKVSYQCKSESAAAI